MSTPLQIVVTAKTTEVDKSLKDIQTALNKTVTIANDADASLKKFGQGLGASGSGLDKLKNQLPNIGSAIGNVSSEFAEFGTLLGGGIVAGIAIAVTLFKNWANSISDTQRAQRALNASLNESKASVAGEVASLTALVGIAQNVSLSTNARQQAIDKLNKDYPQYLGNLTLENSNTAAVKAAIDAQIQSLVRRAQIKGAENLIEKETENLLKAQTELGIETTSVWQKLKAVTSDAFNLGTGGASLVASAIDNQNDAAKAATTAITIYTKKLNELLTQSAIAGDLFTPKPIKVKVEKPPNEKIKDVAKDITESLQHAINQEIKGSLVPLDFNKESKRKIIPGIVFPTEEIQKASLALKEFDEKQRAIGDYVAGVLAPVFQNLFTSVIDGSQSMLSALSSALKQILVQIAATVLKALALAAILSAFGLGKFSDIFNKFSGIPKFAGGVKNFGGGLAVVGEQGPELVNLPRGASVIPNNQISSGMVQPQIFIANSRISGNDIVTSYTRQSATNSRNGG